MNGRKSESEKLLKQSGEKVQGLPIEQPHAPEPIERVEVEDAVPEQLPEGIVQAAEKDVLRRKAHAREKERQYASLISYPSKKRVTSLLVKLTWGLVIGAATVIGVIALVPTAHFLIIGGLAVGAAVFAVKAARDVYVRNREERKLTQKLNTDIDESAAEITKIDIEKYKVLVKAFEDDVINDEPTNNRKEKLYAHLHEMEDSIKRLIPYIKAKKIPAEVMLIEQKRTEIEALKDRVDRKRTVPGTPPKKEYLTPDPHPATVNKEPVSLASRLWTVTKKLGNRSLSFLGGASTGVTIGVGVLTFMAGAAGAAALLSNPVGWAMLAIVGGALVLGAVAIAVDYYFAKSQQRKIDVLTLSKSFVHSRTHRVIGNNANIEHIKLEQDEKMESNKKLALEQAKGTDLATKLTAERSTTAALNEALQKEQVIAQQLADENRALREALKKATEVKAPEPKPVAVNGVHTDVPSVAKSVHSFQASPAREVIPQITVTSPAEKDSEVLQEGAKQPVIKNQ